MELRFIIKDGKKVLQFRNCMTYFLYDGSTKTEWSEWQDVPLVEEKE